MRSKSKKTVNANRVHRGGAETQRNEEEKQEGERRGGGGRIGKHAAKGWHCGNYTALAQIRNKSLPDAGSGSVLKLTHYPDAGQPTQSSYPRSSCSRSSLGHMDFSSGARPQAASAHSARKASYSIYRPPHQLPSLRHLPVPRPIIPHRQMHRKFPIQHRARKKHFPRRVHAL